MAKKKVIATIDTSDPFSTDPGSTTPAPLPPPINPFVSQPATAAPTGLDAQRLQMPVISKPADLAPAPTLNTQPAADKPTALSYLAPVTSGFSAGSQTQPTTNAGGAVMQTVGAGVQGAAAGAAVGGVPGAVIGGVVGVVSGGIQSYLNLKEARANKRTQEKAIAQVNKLNAEQTAYNRQQDALKRSDSQEQLRYNRRQTALASQWKAFQNTMDILNQNMKQDDNIHSMFLAGAH